MQSTSEIVVCFMFDGSPKYGEMAKKAITSFQNSTPNINVGLIVLPNVEKLALDSFISTLPRPDLIRTRNAQNHFNWNPTQYKLDLVEFSDEFKTIFWLDSDTIIYKDMTPFLMSFHLSEQHFAFAKDHVCDDAEFKKRWSGNKEKMFVAQACFMGFKVDHMKEFFTEWEAIWREWITPVPFVRYPDPFPAFPGSAFCIEQYALGMAIEKLIPNFAQVVLQIPRSQIILSPQGTNGGNGLANQNGLSNLHDISLNGSSLGSLALLFGSMGSSHDTSFLSSYLSSAGLLFSTSYSTSYLTSALSSYSTSYSILGSEWTSYGLNSSALSSMFSSLGLEIMSSYGALTGSSYGSSAYSSYGSSFTSSYPSSFGASSYSTSHPSSYALPAVSSYLDLVGSYSSSHHAGLLDSTARVGGVNSSADAALVGGASSYANFGIDLSRYRMVDNFADNVLHYYSANYEVFKS